MKRPNMLSATFCKTVKTPGRYGDGRGGLGLSLLVRTAARGHITKCSTQSVQIDRRPTSIGLGRYPAVTLALARERALENAQAIAEGRDRRRAARSVPTFAEACETVISIHAGGWKPGGKNEQNWRSTMRDYVFPRLGDTPVDAVTGTAVMAVLLPIWTTKTETAGRVRRRVNAVMKWAVAQGHRADNPAGDAISAALPNNNAQVTHRAALPHPQVGAAVAKVRRSGAYRGAVLSFEFLVLTAARSAEVRGVAQHYDIRVAADAVGEKAVAVTWTRRAVEGSMATHPGVYCLRSSEADWDEEALWRHTSPSPIWKPFRSLKSELGLRPIYHHKPLRAEGHLFITVVAYQLVQIVRKRLRERGEHANRTTLRRVLAGQQRVTATFRRAATRSTQGWSSHRLPDQSNASLALP